jgi:hypothetical protein
MRNVFLLSLLAVAALAGDKKASAADKKIGPAEASGDDFAFTATALMDRAEIHQALGADLGDGFVVLRLKATPKGDKPIRISPDDFTLLSRKDGERCPALSASQIAGRGSITVKAAKDQPNSWGTPVANGPIWSGIGTQVKRQPAPSADKEDAKKKDDTAPAATTGPDQTDLLTALKAKSIPDEEIKQSVEGLLYFRMDGKNKLKDLTVLYKGDGGRLVADFK